MYHSWIIVCYNFHRQDPLPHTHTQKKGYCYNQNKALDSVPLHTYVSLRAQLAQLMCYSAKNNALTSTIQKSTYYVGMADA